MLRRASAATWLGGAACALLLAGCSDVLGIHDIAKPVDASAEGTATARDSGGHDATARDAPGSDAEGDVTEESEGGDSGACVEVPTTQPPATGGPACPSDTSTCYPHDLTAWSPTWSPPLDKQGACTAQQISDYYAACRGPNQTPATCRAFAQILDNVACLACMETPVTAAHYGVVITDMQANPLNLAGCIALAEPCNTPCAEALNGVLQCSVAACQASCQADPPSELQQCQQDSEQSCTTCQGFFTSAACIAQLTGAAHPAAALCGFSYAAGSLEEFTAVATMICGS